MIRYELWIKAKRGENVRLGTFKSLQDCYECIVMDGKGTSRKFTIKKVTTEIFDKVTAKTAECRLAQEVQNDKRTGD